MKDFFSVLSGIRRQKTVYSAVNTRDFPVHDVYNPTTISDHQSLNPFAAVFRPLNNKPKWVFLTMVFGLSALTFGTLLIVLDPYNFFFKMKVKFTEGSETFLMWRDPPVVLHLKVYLFNVTNKDAFLRGEDDILKFEEVGPYVYRENMRHGNVTFNANGTMTAVPLHPLVWVPEMSNGTEQDILVLPNIALLSFTHLMSDAAFLTRTFVNTFIRQSSWEPLVEMTAWEFMFGYRTTLLTIGNKFAPSWISFDKLGLIDRMYYFEGDTSTTFTGMTDPRLGGLIDNYNNRPYLPQWEAPCDVVSNSSDGSKFPSYIKPNDTLRFFRKSLCRSMPLVRVGEETLDGLHGYTYHFQDNALDNGENNSSNKCFCRKGHCLAPGLIDVTDCYYGFPIALSYPHFYQADESLLKAVEGLHPDPKLHTTFFTVNPESGLPLRLSVKMQINMALGDLSSMAKVERFAHQVIPMLWTDIYMDGLPSDVSTRFYMYLNVAPATLSVIIYMLLIGGVAFMVLSVAVGFCVPRDINLNDPTAVWRDDMLTREVFPVQKRKPKERDAVATNNNNSKEMEVYYCSLLTPVDRENLDE
ncbi:scavenger receptor class B member 1 isoform X1 [Nilaparvata lugens]|uniref:scavenger receptor class B member 1 isoform X1 n=1 Tax=Nilaparvata lugens TaxID=108931 RepID=UPI000B985433|nr:scavenger receptor class B member 1 isoform X1 [Nilaparvata lugens]